MIKEMRQEIAALHRQVAALSKLRIEGYARSGGGATGGFSFARSAQVSDGQRYIPPKAVVIVKKPAEGDVFLTVREVRYTTSVPRPCETVGEATTCFYEWYGSELEVFAPFGSKPADFAGDEFAAPADDNHPPKFDTVFHRVHRENEVWIIDGKQTNVDTYSFCRILSAVGTEFVVVQEVVAVKERIPGIPSDIWSFKNKGHPETMWIGTWLGRGITPATLVGLQENKAQQVFWFAISSKGLRYL